MTAFPTRARRVALIVAMLALAVASWWRAIDATALERIDGGMKSAFAAFASARALDALISLAQSGEVSAQVGVGVSVAPGELLDPVNDLVERFSDLMLAATVAFGVQKVMLSIGAHWAVALAVTAAALGWAALAAAGRPRPSWLPRLMVVLLLARFALPLAAIGSDLLFRAFLAPTEATARAGLDTLRGQAEVAAAPGAPGAPADAGAASTLRGWLARGADVPAQVERLAAAAGRIAEHVTDLTVAFLLHTLVFPVGLLWVLWHGALAALAALARGGR
jgi:hypothetical protein